MKIDSSSLMFSSQHNSTEKHEIRESLHAWVGERRPDFEGERMQAPVRSNPVADVVSLSGKTPDIPVAEASPINTDEEVANDPMLMLVKSLVERLTGRAIKLLSLNDLQPKMESPQLQAPPAQNNNSAPPSQRFGVEYDYHETHQETEQTSFTARGVVKTADGKEISFDLTLDMKREHTEEINVSVRLGDAARQKKDPLVINFSGTAAQLTDKKFSFDLNADGTAEKISFVVPGSGFLALDRNGDGVINNGSELFGAATGNGFAELAAHDQDHNNWIDERDAVYSKLRILTRDSAGHDTLSTLADKNVGAIYLGNTSTPFELKNSQNQSDGQIKSSGVYVAEDGAVHTVQQVDLTV